MLRSSGGLSRRKPRIELIDASCDAENCRTHSAYSSPELWEQTGAYKWTGYKYEGPRMLVHIAKSAAEFIDTILEQVNQDNEGRSGFTQRAVRRCREKWPKYNWVICHTDHSTHFDGKQGKEWGHFHREYDIQIGGTIGYEVYWFESGKFVRHGDGGYLNWAYFGNVKSVSDDGATVVFS
ncbi:hypothetical protein NMY22_g10761 [Coprinellus aureogranulatus]|nr:hypothetical protein NMY22_g10761 [Coprinellus aureogranulatus]